MEHYQTSGRASSPSIILPPEHFDGWQQSDYDAARDRYAAFVASLRIDSTPPPCDGVERPLLVNRSISQRTTVEEILVYPSAVKLCRKSYDEKTSDVPPPPRGDISGFSDRSRRNLRFIAGNPSEKLISQFCPTYHNSNPDGRTVKEHLNTFLTAVRRNYRTVKYLWVLEFQTRGVPHFHIFFNLEHSTPGLHDFLAETWNRIAEPDSRKHLLVHKNQRAFIPWDMYTTSYLTKYLEKEKQKHVPAGFTGCGRFWGASRGLLATPAAYAPEDLEHLEQVEPSTGEVTDPIPYIVRTLGKLHERRLRKTPWKSKARTGLASYTLHTAAPAARQLLAYLQKTAGTANDLPF